MLAPQINTHVKDGLARLMEQYKGRSRIVGMLQSFIEGAQEIENLLYSMDAGMQIWDGTSTPAIGAQLDIIGDIVGIKRNGLPDDQYVLFIFGKIAENFSDTTTETILTVISYVFQTDNVFMADSYPAGFHFEVFSTPIPEALWPVASGIISGAKGAGIRIVFSAAASHDQIFRFEGPGVTGSLNGFGDETNPSIGGKFIEQIS